MLRLSPPHNDDCVPSKSDTDFMGELRRLTGQKHSIIVTPNGKTALFDERGIIETDIVSNHISDERRKALMRLLGGTMNDKQR